MGPEILKEGHLIRRNGAGPAIEIARCPRIVGQPGDFPTKGIHQGQGEARCLGHVCQECTLKGVICSFTGGHMWARGGGGAGWNTDEGDQSRRLRGPIFPAGPEDAPPASIRPNQVTVVSSSGGIAARIARSRSRSSRYSGLVERGRPKGMSDPGSRPPQGGESTRGKGTHSALAWRSVVQRPHTRVNRPRASAAASASDGSSWAW